jgi:tetratricopeptide (TPR) repeat protein
MNNVGYQLLMTGKKKEALEIFKINVEAFPKSGNAYDSLGEAYLADGDTKLAIANYKKSIELDPKNEHGKEVLAEILKKK